MNINNDKNPKHSFRPASAVKGSMQSQSTFSISLVAIALGVFSVVSALTIGHIAYRKTLQATERSFQNFYPLLGHCHPEQRCHEV